MEKEMKEAKKFLDDELVQFRKSNVRIIALDMLVLEQNQLTTLYNIQLLLQKILQASVSPKVFSEAMQEIKKKLTELRNGE